MAAEVWASGGAGTLSNTLTTTLNNSAYDRMLKIHIGQNATPTNLTLDDGSKKVVDAHPLDANVPRSFGPFFLPSGTNLRGGGSAGAHGDYRIDELRVNQ